MGPLNLLYVGSGFPWGDGGRLECGCGQDCSYGGEASVSFVSPGEATDSFSSGTDHVDCVLVDAGLPEAVFHGVGEALDGTPLVAVGGEAGEAVARGVDDQVDRDVPVHVLVNRARNAVDGKQFRLDFKDYWLLVETVADGMYLLDREGVVQTANDALVEILGMPRGEIEGSHVSEFMRPEDVRKGEELIRELLESGDRWGSYEVTVEVDGEMRAFEVSLAVVTEAGEYSGSVGVMHDVEEMKERERELKMYETMINTVPDTVAAIDPEGYIVESNRNTLSGYPREELIGLNLEEIMTEETFEESVEKVKGLLKEADVEQKTLEYDLIDRDGEPVPVESTFSLLPFEDGEFQGTISVTRDISDRKEREEKIRRKNRQLELLNRIVRHDIRNDMNIVSGTSEFLMERLEGSDLEDVEIIHEVSNEVIELTEAIRTLMESIKSEEPELVEIDLHEMLEGVVKKSRLSFEEAEFQVESLPEVEVMANEMLSSVFTNLLNNAVRHHDGDPVVEVGVEERDGEVVVCVADDGPGVPDGKKNEIFGRGEKGLASPGSGVGLYLVDMLVQQYGGKVWVKDNEPRGAVFKVQLNKI